MKQFGFTLILGTEHSNVSNVSLSYKEIIDNKGMKAFSHLIPQLKDDKLFYDDNNYTIILDGVVLNRLSLMEPNVTWAKTVIELYQKCGDLFFKDWRGSFGGIIYDKTHSRYIIFSDHVGSKFIYYSFLG